MTDTITNGASSAYESIASSASRVLPVASTLVSEATGFSALSESYSGTPAANPHQPTEFTSDPTEVPDSSTEQDAQSIPAREDNREETERGPSQPDRPSQPQTSIGTESGIPTTGGAGTTVSPDDDVKAALEKENGSSKAAVGVDYSDQPCPTADARRDNPTSEPAQGKMHFDSKDEQTNGSSGYSSAEHASGSSATRSESTAATSASEDQEARSTASKGVSFKDKLKGQAKVMAGKITRNEEKVEQGKTLKAGGAGGDA